ncbi:hypothetical protein RhiirA5_418499 [Rhizophagus irregularis]|uniref:EF-hand domain-containing protein n=1 Tax=Rhizophagus irregularis TaxID=588596 RepID=A0A2N0PK51_9GLOM|nr:hypothetical protein RhiirA5_418499 [Rhizophagus irregularis]CAB4491594.1 unnamed protein product [Rhizophagus irregularis]CAB5180819.1 unnamed protein product [Rhizophagus irregularis]
MNNLIIIQQKGYNKRVVFAIDEASAASTLFYPRFANSRGHDSGLLTPLVMFLDNFQVPIIIAGTSFSLEYGKSNSDIGKGKTPNYLIDFEMLTVENIESYLERFLSLSDCNLKDIVELKYLAGRPRFAARIVLEVIRLEKNGNGFISKQDVLKEAIKQTINVISGQLEFKFSEIVEKKNPYDIVDFHAWKNIMETLFVNCWFFGSYMASYEINDHKIFLIENGIAHLLKNNKSFLAIDEPLSVDAVKKVLLPIYKRPDVAILQKLIAELKRNATKKSDTSKGATWQYLAQAGLMNFNEKTVADFVHTIYGDDIVFEIGGIKKMNLPEWTNKAIIKIESYGDLKKLSWKLHDKFEDDVKLIEMLLGNPTNRVYMLNPNPIMRPYGVYIGNNIDHIDDYWTLLISVKIYEGLFSGKSVGNNKRTTDWNYVYYEDDEDENTHQIKKHVIRRKLDTMRNKYVHQGSIRIHFILPGLAEGRNKSEDQGGCRVEGNDIIMYIDQNLLNKYFRDSQYVDVINNIFERN